MCVNSGVGCFSILHELHPPARAHPKSAKRVLPNCAPLFATMSAASSSSRRRNYLLHPHRTDGLIGFIKDMLHHSFVLDTMASTTDATWRHIEELIEEHRAIVSAIDAGKQQARASRLSESVPTVSRFFTPLPLREVCPTTFSRVGLLCLQRLHRAPPPHSPLPTTTF